MSCVPTTVHRCAEPVAAGVPLIVFLPAALAVVALLGFFCASLVQREDRTVRLVAGLSTAVLILVQVLVLISWAIGSALQSFANIWEHLPF